MAIILCPDDDIRRLCRSKYTISKLPHAPIQIVNTQHHHNQQRTQPIFNFTYLSITNPVQAKAKAHQAGLGGGLLGSGLGVFGGVGAPPMLKWALFWGCSVCGVVFMGVIMLFELD